jgi:hypothetical protein
LCGFLFRPYKHSCSNPSCHSAILTCGQVKRARELDVCASLPEHQAAAARVRCVLTLLRCVVTLLRGVVTLLRGVVTRNPTQGCGNPTQGCGNPTQGCGNPTQGCGNPHARAGRRRRRSRRWPRSCSSWRHPRPKRAERRGGASRRGSSTTVSRSDIRFILTF